MPINVTKANTKIMRQSGGWIKAVHDTGQLDAQGKAITVSATITQASIEKEAGVLLPKARVKAILEGALNDVAVTIEQEMLAL